MLQKHQRIRKSKRSKEDLKGPRGIKKKEFYRLYVSWKTTLFPANFYLTKIYIFDNFLAVDNAPFVLVVLKYTVYVQP